MKASALSGSSNGLLPEGLIGFPEGHFGLSSEILVGRLGSFGASMAPVARDSKLRGSI